MSIIITDLKQRIWKQAKQDLARVEAAKEAAGTNDNSEAYWRKVLQQFKRKKTPHVLSPDCRERYLNTYKSFQDREYPNMVKDHGYQPTDVPDTSTANGLTNFICKFIMHSGFRATRINVSGRLVDKQVTDESGNKFTEKKMIKSSTRKGSADVSSTIHGRSVMWEVKIGRDKPSADQLKEQSLERKAGGEYFFTHTAEEFFMQYDSLVRQKTLF